VNVTVGGGLQNLDQHLSPWFPFEPAKFRGVHHDDRVMAMKGNQLRTFSMGTTNDITEMSLRIL